MAQAVKNPPAVAGDKRDSVRCLGQGRSPEGGNGNPLQYSCLEHPMAEEPGGLQSGGSQRVRHNKSNLAHMHRAGLLKVDCASAALGDSLGLGDLVQ